MEKITITDSFQISLYTPTELKAHLDKFIIGQDAAKRAISVAVYNHYKRLFINMNASDSTRIDKSNVILAGPTGCGKSAIIKCIAKYMGVPYYIGDATSLTQAGYVGDDVESLLSGLLRKCDYDIKKAQCGIIFIDEIDKLAKKGAGTSITRDVGGEGVQQALLKIIEGTKASVPPQGGRKHPNQEMLEIDTTNILFILGGAFVGLDKIIDQRINEQTIGFDSAESTMSDQDKVDMLNKVIPDDLVKFGLIPELIGRMPVSVALKELTRDDLISILTKPKNAITKQFQASFAMDDVELTFTDDAIAEIADIAIRQETGARGLRAIVEKILLDIMFEVPSIKGKKKLEVTKEIVTQEKSIDVEKLLA